MTQPKNAAAIEAAANTAPVQTKTKEEVLALLRESTRVADADLNSLTSSLFFDFDKQREHRKTNVFNFAFSGFEVWADKTTGEEKECAKLLDAETGDDFLNSDVVLMSSLKKWKEANPEAKAVFIRVKYDGEMVKTANGKYRKLTVLTF